MYYFVLNVDFYQNVPYSTFKYIRPWNELGNSNIFAVILEAFKDGGNGTVDLEVTDWWLDMFLQEFLVERWTHGSIQVVEVAKKSQIIILFW